jgi:hypothetical protein
MLRPVAVELKQMVSRPTGRASVLLRKTQMPFRGKSDDDEVELELEEEWAVEGMRQNIVIGSQTLLFLITICYLSHMYKYIQVYTRSGTCDFVRAIEVHLEFFAIAETFLYLASCAVLCKCIYMPELKLYLPVVFITSIFCLLIALTPFTISCRGMLELGICQGLEIPADATSATCRDTIAHKWLLTESCIEAIKEMGGKKKTGARSIFHQLSQTIGIAKQDVNVLDCSMQGITPATLHFMWIQVFTPRIIPTREWMIFNYFWIFVMYLGLGLSSRTTSSEHIYNKRDIAITVLMLILGNIYASQKKY